MQRYEWCILPNKASTNALLRHVLHAIQVTPLTLPDGLPASLSAPIASSTKEGGWETDPPPPFDARSHYSSEELSELMRFQLRPNGAFLRRSHVHPSQELAAIPQSALSQTMDHYYLKQWNRRRYNRFELFSEYYSTKYEYKLNQDGQEFRYSGLHRLREANRNYLDALRGNADGTFKGQDRAEADYSPWPFRQGIQFRWKSGL